MYLSGFFIVLFLILLTLQLYMQFFSKFVRNTPHIPGPKATLLFGNYLDFGTTPSDVFANIIRMWKECGCTFKVSCGPKYFLMTAEPRHFEVLLSCNTNISKGITYKYLVPWLGRGLLTSTGETWKKHRKLLTPAFHLKTLEMYLDSFNKNGNILVEKLKHHVNGEEFDIYEYINLNTLDIICETALRMTLNAQENSSTQYVEAIRGMAAVFTKRMFSPWLHFDYFIFNWCPTARKQRKFLKILHSTSNKVIRERKEEYWRNKSNDIDNNYQGYGISRQKNYAFLDVLLEYSRANDYFTNEEIRQEVDTFMFRGHDTTTSAIMFCLRLLALHPHIQDRVYNELKMIFGTSDRDLTAAELHEMKYLECVIKESLRLYPSVPFFSRELDTDVKFDELDLPAGTNIVFNVYCLHRNPEIFPEPELFNPDRFLPENVQGRHPFAYVPFSAGPRNCIGQRFALMELKAIISKLLRNYRLIADGSHELKLSWEFVLRSSNGIFLRIVDRD